MKSGVGIVQLSIDDGVTVALVILFKKPFLARYVVDTGRPEDRYQPAKSLCEHHLAAKVHRMRYERSCSGPQVFLKPCGSAFNRQGVSCYSGNPLAPSNARFIF